VLIEAALEARLERDARERELRGPRSVVVRGGGSRAHEPGAIEVALVVGERLGVAGVVQEARLGQLGDGVVDCARLDPFALQAGAQLGHRPLATVNRPMSQLDRPFPLSRQVVHDPSSLAR